MRDWFGRGRSGPACDCTPVRECQRLVIDASDCPGEGRFDDADACVATAVDALEGGIERVIVRNRGWERAYLDGDAALLVAAGQFADRVEPHDARLARRARTAPVAAAREATGRAGPVERIAAETGLAVCAGRYGGIEDLRPHVGPEIGHARVVPDPPPDAALLDRRSLRTGATVRLYEREEGLPTYHVEPVEVTLSETELATLSTAHERLAEGAVGGRGGAYRAVRDVADEAIPVEILGSVLAKHTEDYGVLVDLFADEAVSDVFATAPVRETALRVRVDGRLARTNVRLSADGVDALASQFRLESGRAFSRASPTLDAAVTAGQRRIRVAGTADPVTDGVAFALRAHDDEAWTLRRLVATGTLTPTAAAVLSVAVDRAAALLVAGPRGAGKTTTLGALCRALPRSVRTLVVEDTPELPVEKLRAEGRDAQSLLTASGDGPGLTPAHALRTALRLGEGAIVVGEVRGDEAAVLYEAMRVGASGSAVLGTIHGDGGEAVRERVVADLGVPESSFAATDLVVTMGPPDDGGHHVASIEEVIGGEGVRFASLFEREEGRLRPTGRIERGDSRVIADLCAGEEPYADLLAVIESRTEEFRRDDPDTAETPGTDGDVSTAGR